MKGSFSNSLAQWLIPLLLPVYLLTVRTKIFGNVPEKNAIFIFWHNKMLIGWRLFKGKRYTALVSQSKDGEILSRMLKKWKYNVVRGSSSKGGKEALDEIASDKLNSSVVITPDGPRGPAGIIKNGALILSNKTGFPIIPVSISYSRSKVLSKSWDKFEIPLPFSTCTVKFGDEFYYSEYLPDPELDQFKTRLAKQM
ncbi:MAG: lysophospholipid acyltransferase family protein [Ignavibacteriae bacterium]|nr:lysophospholipid acyltransferase family protein [Ignavibacteriota bacterium]MCB9243424.1 lysophospholipid acyltransferase family protein [Ignavibacteriales bacterium]